LGVQKKSYAISACKCAYESVKITQKLNHKWQKIGISNIVPKIGIVTGNVLVGNIGTDYRLQYSLFGDQVNFMYRLVDANNTFQTQILISQSTKDIVEKEISLQRVDEIMIKGKKDPQVLYTII
jgi:adenylate cyclase